MTKDEDDWLSDFLEATQASARQSQAAAEKDYGSKLKLLTPRFERARACDTGEELAKRIAASEALAGQKKFDAASDALDGAYVLAASLLSASAIAAVVPEEVAPNNRETDLDENSAELTPTEGPPKPNEPSAAVLNEPTVSINADAPETTAAENLEDGSSPLEEPAAPSDEPAAKAVSDDSDASIEGALADLLGETTSEPVAGGKEVSSDEDSSPKAADEEPPKESGS